MSRLLTVIDRLARRRGSDSFSFDSRNCPTEFGTEVTEIDGIITDTPELRQWRSNTGIIYSAENYDMRLGRGWLLRELLKNVEFDNVLEVGCNWGNNLHILAEFGNGKQVYGIDPIEDILTGGQALLSVATAFALPFAQKAFDLVLCAGVLCHIAPERLAPALKEIERVCGKYALIIDYVADHEEAITFRGTHQLWKRDFTKRVGEETNLKLIIGGVTDAWDEKSLMKYTLWQRR